MKEEEILSGLLEKMGKKLEDLRKKQGYSSHETFAYDNELPRVQYWRIEKGKTNVTLKSLVKILAVHKLTVEEFFADLLKDKKPNSKK